MMEKRIKDLAWNTFKQTGNIDTFMEFMKVKNMQNNEEIRTNSKNAKYRGRTIWESLKQKESFFQKTI